MNYKFVRNSSKGKAVMSQAVVVKVLGISPTAYYNTNEKFPWLIDVVHHEYGRIYVKYSILTGIGRAEGYKFLIDKTVKCDTYLFLGFDKDWQNIGTIFIIPNKGWIKNIGTACICKNTDGSKYEEFRKDVKPYNDAYHDFVSFIGGNAAVGISDVKGWLKCGESNIEKDAGLGNV